MLIHRYLSNLKSAVLIFKVYREVYDEYKEASNDLYVVTFTRNIED